MISHSHSAGASSRKQGRQEKEYLKSYLRSKKMRFTRQREITLNAFLSEEGHISAEEIYFKLRRKYPRFGRSTVFRTVNLLREAALAREVNFIGKRRRFEHEYEHPHHDHMLCLRCGKTIEFIKPSIEKIQENLVNEFDFLPIRHRLEIFGYCKYCKER